MNNIIKGMKILEQTPIKEYTMVSDILTWLGIAIALLSVVFLIIKIKEKERIDIKSKMFKGFLFFYVFGLAMSLFSIMHFPWFYKETGKYTYQCELEDNVSSNYISNNFNILHVKDGVWTIEDK